MIAGMTEGEFLHFSIPVRHKKAAEILRLFYQLQDARQLELYRRIEQWCAWPKLCETDFAALSDRYHMHLKEAGISWQEHNLLSNPFHQKDTPSSVCFLPISIYLDNLRSAFNVGSILRTTEAFRLGKVCFAKQTPFVDNPKVQKTSMGTCDKLICEQNVELEHLPRPIIALETHCSATSLFDFAFPKTFTLVLGNEEYGVSKELLKQAEHIVQIPLVGYKNSLNVASAFAIAAGVISHQLRNLNT